MPEIVVAPDANTGAYDIHNDWPIPVWVTELVGYFFYYDDSAPVQFRMRKTTDRGRTWSAPSAAINTGAIEPGEAHAVYYDRSTPGITTTHIHLIWTQLDAVVYKFFDPNTDTFGPLRTVFSPGSAQATHVQIGVARSTELWAAWNGNDATLGRDNRRSPADGSSWTDPGANFLEGSAGADSFFIMPASNTGDDGDMWMVYHDDTANEISLKFFDNSVPSFTETIIASATWQAIDGAVSVRHSDGHLFLALQTNSLAAHDLECWEINSAVSFTQRTNLLTGVTAPRQAAMTIDQTTGRIYVAWLANFSNGNIDFSSSDDGGVTWTAPAQFSFATTPSPRLVLASLSVAVGDTGRWMPFWNESFAFEEWRTNFDNSLALGVPVPAAVTGQQQKLLLL